MILNSRTFYINSRNRVSGTDSDFKYSIELDPNVSYTHCCVLQASIPHSYYLVESPYNTFTLKELTDLITITVPEGNYSVKSFLTAIQSLLNSSTLHSWTYAITYPTVSSEADTGKYTFTVSGNSGNQPSFIFDTNPIYEQMGFLESSTNAFVANTITSTSCIKMQIEDTIYIHSDIVGGEVDNVLQEVYANASSNFSAITYQVSNLEASSKRITTSNNNIYHFYIYSEDGTPINLNNINLNFSLIIYQKADFYSMISNFFKYFVSIKN